MPDSFGNAGSIAYSFITIFCQLSLQTYSKALSVPKSVRPEKLCEHGYKQGYIVD